MLVENIGAEEVAVGQHQTQRFAAGALAGKCFLEDLPRQHQARRLAADLAGADPMRTDRSQILDVEVFFGDADELQLLADHRADQHDLDLLQVMLDVDPLLRRQRLVFLGLLEEPFPRRQLRVEREDFLARFAQLEHLARDIIEAVQRQIVGEVVVRPLIPDDAQPALPDVGGLVGVGIHEPFALLRFDRFLFDLFLEAFRIDDAAHEQLVAHPLTDRGGEDREAADAQIDAPDLPHIVRFVHFVRHRRISAGGLMARVYSEGRKVTSGRTPAATTDESPRQPNVL